MTSNLNYHEAADILRDVYPGEAQYEAIQTLFHCNDNMAKALVDVVHERDHLRDALQLYKAGRDFAHRLAVMLECVLLGGKGTWDEGHTLLEEYREACRIESNEVPTCMGEPITDVRAHVRAGCQYC